MSMYVEKISQIYAISTLKTYSLAPPNAPFPLIDVIHELDFFYQINFIFLLIFIVSLHIH